MSAANDWNLRWLERMRAINGGPLPVVNDQRPWESQYQAMQAPVPSWGGLNQAAQDTGAPNSLDAFQRQVTASPFMKQDTAAGESAQGPWSDNTPVQGGGATLGLGGERLPFTGTWGTFGTTYADPGGGWNPWSLYDGREGFDGTAVDGWYNAAADTAKGWGPNGTPERDRDRVWRMTLDDLGPNPGGQPPERVKAAFLNNVARLKRDYMNTPGMGAQAWATSAFAGYDRLPGTQGGQAATSGPAPGRGDQQNQGGSTVGPNDPLNPYNTPTGSTGTQPGGTGLGVIPPSTAGKSNFGGAGLINQGNPEQVTRQYMQSHNMNPDGHGFFGDFIRKLMGNLVPALMSLTLDQNGKPAMDQLANPGSFLDPIFFGGAGTLGANLGNFANRAQAGLASAMPGMEADTQASLLRNLTALRTVGMNPYLGQATNNRLDTGINRAKDYAFGLAQQGQDTPDEWSLMDFINSLQGRR